MGSEQIIEMFLKDGDNPNIIVDGETPLYKAVYSENITLVEMLLDIGADPNINLNMERESWRQTPLNIAFETLNIPIVKLLLESGAKPNDNDDETNLFWIFENEDASSKQKFAATQLLLEHGYELYNFDYGLFINIKDSEIEIAKLLLEYVKYPNIKNKALLSAAKTNQIEMVRLLLDNGADPNFQNEDNTTPLKAAIEKQNLPMMILLLDRGADPNYVWKDPDEYDDINMLQLARKVRFRNGLQYLETFISEKNKMQNREQRLATSMALNPRLGQDSIFNSIDEGGLFDRIASYVPEYNSKYAPDIGRRMIEEDNEDPLTKSKQRLATIKGIRDRNSVLKHLREPELMENVNEYLSSMRPQPSVQNRMMLEEQTGTMGGLGGLGGLGAPTASEPEPEVQPKVASGPKRSKAPKKKSKASKGPKKPKKKKSKKPKKK